MPKLAQYELTLLDWVEAHRGYRKYVASAGKCWPAFQTQFGFVPCYVNSRLTGRGIPVSCEVDIYGALSEFIGTCVSNDAVTLLDINNSVPDDMYEEIIKGKFDYTHKDTFMGFHCGNTCSRKLAILQHEVSDDHGKIPSGRGNTAELSKATSYRATSPSIVCRAPQTASCVLMWHRARFFR